MTYSPSNYNADLHALSQRIYAEQNLQNSYDNFSYNNPNFYPNNEPVNIYTDTANYPNKHNYSQQNLELEKLKFLENLEQTLPPVFTRQEAAKHLGGLISAKTMSNCDALGTGVRNKVKIGSKVGYVKADFMDWIRTKLH